MTDSFTFYDQLRDLVNVMKSKDGSDAEIETKLKEIYFELGNERGWFKNEKVV